MTPQRKVWIGISRVMIEVTKAQYQEFIDEYNSQDGIPNCKGLLANGQWRCTRKVGHEGLHIAHLSDSRPIAIWEQTTE